MEDDLKAIIKPQYVDQIPKAVKGTVQAVLERKNETNRLEEFADQLELNHVFDHNIGDLSGGELQRFAIAVVCIQKADM